MLEGRRAPGRYCLRRCYCGGCPQYAEQVAANEALRQREHEDRERHTRHRDPREVKAD